MANANTELAKSVLSFGVILALTRTGGPRTGSRVGSTSDRAGCAVALLVQTVSTTTIEARDLVPSCVPGARRPGHNAAPRSSCVPPISVGP